MERILEIEMEEQYGEKQKILQTLILRKDKQGKGSILFSIDNSIPFELVIETVTYRKEMGKYWGEKIGI